MPKTIQNNASSKVLILGNGPSLRQDYFEEIIDSGIACIGMNAAYRYWERIGWYPYAYVCADVQLGPSHADRIFEMIEKGLCKHFLLRANMLRLRPELAGRKNVLFLEQLNQEYKHICKRYGINSRPSPFFDSPRLANWITTGGTALRFASYLGFSRLGIIGIDCNYVEILPEAEHDSRGKNVLRITKTPEKNPNYFFEDYQQKGDIYHVPNPGSDKKPDDPVLHLVAIQSVNIDNRFYKYGLDFCICTKKSELYRQGIFPYCSLRDFLNKCKIQFLEEPFFSIITVTRNSAQTIGRTIENVLAQGFKNFEYIIVDGDSSDETLAVIRKYASLFEGRMVWVSEPDSGIYEAMNKGIRLSRGKYINFINSNAWLEYDILSFMYNVIQKNPNNEIYYGSQIWHHPNSSSIKNFFSHENIDANFLHHGVSFIARETYTQIGGYNEFFRFAGEHHFFMTAKAKGCSFLNIPEKVVSHYYLEENPQRIMKQYKREIFYASLLLGKNHSFFKKLCWYGVLFRKYLGIRYPRVKTLFLKQLERISKAIYVITKNPKQIFYYMNRALELIRHKLPF